MLIAIQSTGVAKITQAARIVVISGRTTVYAWQRCLRRYTITVAGRDVSAFRVGCVSACDGSDRTSSMARGLRCLRSRSSLRCRSGISMGAPHERRRGRLVDPLNSSNLPPIMIRTSTPTMPAPSARSWRWPMPCCLRRRRCCCCHRPWNSRTWLPKPGSFTSHPFASPFSLVLLRSPEID
jgi:hypothetical protein